ncbi:MAG: hypothetical protein LKF58_04865 [Bacilli bacterium]|jgi:hypothetical protein|nr:hypothetical protein [Bacilli bacterium]MCH4211081.1 hypothetical protein [Bacilli bacterium]MCH4277678.1 hypothetical protein [Bacilli bacterium]MCI2055341.1 hypothetical protein [Bacilli bacterium]
MKKKILVEAMLLSMASVALTSCGSSSTNTIGNTYNSTPTATYSQIEAGNYGFEVSLITYSESSLSLVDSSTYRLTNEYTQYIVDWSMAFTSYVITLGQYSQTGSDTEAGTITYSLAAATSVSYTSHTNEGDVYLDSDNFPEETDAATNGGFATKDDLLNAYNKTYTATVNTNTYLLSIAEESAS